MWRYELGVCFSFLGLLILPFAIASELMEKVHLGQSLLIASTGALVFLRRGATSTAGGVASPRALPCTDLWCPFRAAEKGDSRLTQGVTLG